MLNYYCPKCKIEIKKINRIINIHLTGDEKIINLYQCAKCKKYYLIISMEATIGPGTNYFAFRIDLKNNEAQKIKAMMEECSQYDGDDCPAHKFLDEFDNNNKHRRVILEDEIERWT